MRAEAVRSIPLVDEPLGLADNRQRIVHEGRKAPARRNRLIAVPKLSLRRRTKIRFMMR